MTKTLVARLVRRRVTWLVLAVGLLLVAFPLAHGIILTALYIPVFVLLVGLILRGVAFDFRAKVPTELAMSGNGGIVRFQAPPGKVDLRLTIEGEGTGTLDTEDRTLDLPDLSAPDVHLSTPKVWLARSALEFTKLTSGIPPAPSATRESSAKTIHRAA